MRKTLKPSPKYSLNSAFSNVATFYDDVVNIRRLCADGYKLAIVSNWDTSLGTLTELLGIVHYFDIIVPSHDESVRSVKLDPQIFEYTMKLVGVSAEETVHVGDTYEADIIGTEGVGIRPILIGTSLTLIGGKKLFNVLRSCWNCLRGRNIENNLTFFA